MNTIPWFERHLKFGYPIEMLPYILERLNGTAVRIETKVKGISNEILSKQFDGNQFSQRLSGWQLTIGRKLI